VSRKDKTRVIEILYAWLHATRDEWESPTRTILVRETRELIAKLKEEKTK
jgi:hypothetical protein